MRKFWLVAIFALISRSADAQFLSMSAALSPRGFPTGVSIPTIAPTDAVYPGCPTPPTTFGNVWNFSPSGQTQAAMTTAGISMNPSVSPHQGDATHPWNSLEAAFTLQTGYTTPLLSAVNGSTGPIQPGDEILLASGSYGKISGGGRSVPTNQIINVPAVTIAAGSSQTPVLSTVQMFGVTGLVLNGLTVQSVVDSDSNALVNISDGANAGLTNTNIVLMNMAISSAPLVTAQGWTQAQFIANARPGVFIQGSSASSNLTCTSIVNSRVSVVHFRGSGAVTVQADDSLIQNVQVDHFTAQGIQYNASNFAGIKNYIHDIYNDGDAGDFFDYKGALQGIGAYNGQGPQQNIYLARNEIIDALDSTLPAATALQGIESTVGDWTNVVIIDNLIATSGCGALITGNIHNGLITNNSIIDGGNSSLQPGCVPSLTILQAHGGGTGPNGSMPSNVRVTNNITPYLAFSGYSLTVDHNIQTGLTSAGYIYSPWGIGGVQGNLIYGGPAINAVTSASTLALGWGGCSGTSPPLSTVCAVAAGATNLLDGYGAAHEFTAVPTAGSFPMSPAPNFTLLSGSPAKTSGGATLVPPISDFNGATFAPPYSIGALN